MKSVPFDRRENGIGNEEAAQRPTSFLWFFGFGFRERRTARRRGGGNVEISPFLRDFQGTVESVENLFLVFHAFHGPGISTAPAPLAERRRNGRRVWHCRSSLRLGRAHPASAFGVAHGQRLSSPVPAKLSPGFRHCSAPASDFSFSNGVR